ncbi:MAG: hypothetical protein ISN29_06350 [Gammaproteobacteria bacterium AqS3]|nr:hypothetical protein [Gammaproteobacteria bacterium AqS3]
MLLCTAAGALLLCALGLHWLYWQVGQLEQRTAWLEDRLAGAVEEFSVRDIDGDWGDWGIRLEAHHIDLAGGARVLWRARADSLVLRFNLRDWVMGRDASLLRIEGLNVDLDFTDADADPINWRAVQRVISDWVMNSGSIDSAVLTLNLPDGQVLRLTPIDLNWRQFDGSVHLRLDAHLPEQLAIPGQRPPQLHLYARDQDDRVNWQLQLDDLDASDLLSFAGIELVTGMQLIGALGDEGFRMAGTLHPSRLLWKRRAGPGELRINLPALPLLGHQEAGGGLSLDADLSHLNVNGESVDLGVLSLNWSEDDEIAVQLDRIDLSSGVAALIDMRLLSDPINAGVRQVDLRGMIGPVHIRHRLGADPSEARIRARFDSVEISSWNSVPEISEVSGVLDGSLRSGLVRAASDRLTLGMPRLFSSIWQIPDIGVVLGWRLDGRRMRFLTEPICISYDPGSACVEIGLRLPLERPRDVRMSMSVGIAEGRGQYMHEFLPSTEATAAVSEWLGSSIRAEAARGVLIFEGLPVRIHPDLRRSLNMRLAVKGGRARLFEQDDLVENLSGVLDFKLNRHVRFSLSEGRFSGLPVHPGGRLDIDLSQGGAVAPIRVDARIDADAGALTGVIGRLPVPQNVRDLFSDRMKLSGPVSANGRIGWSLGNPTETLDLNIDMMLQGVDLGFAGSGFRVASMQGPLRYRNLGLLQSDGLRARVFDTSVVLRLKEEQRAGVSRIDFDGEIPIDHLLASLDFPESITRHLQGPVRHTGTLILDSARGDVLPLTVALDLGRVRTQLPPALDLSGSTEPLRVDAQISLDERQRPSVYEARHGERLAGRVEYEQDQWRSSLKLGRFQPGWPERLAPGLSVSGRLAQLHPMQWFPLIDTGAGAEGIALHIDVSAQRAEVLGLNLENLALTKRPDEPLNFVSRHIRGSLEFGLRGLHLRLDQLLWRNVWFEQMQLGSDGLFAGDGVNLSVDLRRLDAAGLDAPISADLDILLASDRSEMRVYDADAMGFYIAGEEPLIYRYDGAVSQLEGQLGTDSLEQVLADVEVIENLGGAEFGLLLDWNGSLQDIPERLQSAEFNGDLEVDLSQGGLRVSRSNSFLFRLGSMINLNSVIKRTMKLDFRWLFDRGIQFDRLRGGLRISDGEIELTGKGIRIENSAGVTHITGRVLRQTSKPPESVRPVPGASAADAAGRGAPDEDSDKPWTGWPERLDLFSHVEAPLGTSASLFFAAIGQWPMVVASLAARKRINDASGIQFHIGGTLDEPEVSRIISEDDIPTAGSSAVEPGGEPEK